MTRSADKKAAECHVLNFFYDDDNGCALTVFVNGTRFHVIADAERLKSNTGDGETIQQEYENLIKAVRDELEQDENTQDLERSKDLEAAELHDPDNNCSDSQDSGHGTVEEDKVDDPESDVDHDSAVDVTEQEQVVKKVGIRDNGVALGKQFVSESERVLQSWMLSPLKDIFETLHLRPSPKEQTLQEWYNGPAYFYNLQIENNTLSAKQEESSPALEQRMRELIPHMPLPKYIKDLNIPYVKAEDILVVQEGAEPEPYHPTRVKVEGNIQFLKLVDMTSYQPTKREIKLLKEVEKKGLHEKIHIPQVLGLVYEKSKTEIMGFLQTDIDEPTPLTRMLDSDVIEEHREGWAKEVERVNTLLHDNKIIWGDAKADNFMVDKHNNLWIIDFGGSYTEGWVDPELAETKEGDDMGTEKIINALKDPEANTYGEGEESNEAGTNQTKGNAPKKRSRSAEDDEENVEEYLSKRRR